MQQLALAGVLREFSIEDVLSLLEWNKTGTLAVRQRQEEIKISFVDGSIADAEHIGVPQFSLGEVLRRAGYLTSRQLQEFTILRKGSRRQVEAALIGLQLIPKQVLDDFLRLQIKNAVCHVFSWQDGTFGFRSEMPLLGSNPSLNVSIREAVANGKERRAEWEVLSRRIRGLDYVVESVGSPTQSHLSQISPCAKRFLDLIDGQSSTRMIAQCLFIDDLQAAKAMNELSDAGTAKVSFHLPLVTAHGYAGSVRDGQSKEELTRTIAKSQLFMANSSSYQEEDRIKAMLRALQDCINDLLTYQDYRRTIGEETALSSQVDGYLEEQLQQLLADLQARYPAAGAVQVKNRRIDVADLIETYNLILGDMRHAFYTEAIRGLLVLVERVFDWVAGEGIQSPAVAAECQEEWLGFLDDIGAKVDEIAMASG